MEASAKLDTPLATRIMHSMNLMKKIGHSLFLIAALAAFAPLSGCAGSVSEDSAEGAAGAFTYERFPSREAVKSALHSFSLSPESNRMRAAVPLNDFFGERVNGAYSANYTVEFIRSPQGPRPIVAMHSTFPTPQGFDYLKNNNNRNKDVHVFKVAESLGVSVNPFPEAVKLPSSAGKGEILLRLWTDFRKMGRGVPEGYPEAQLLQDLARVSIWAYVSGNSDGVHNSGNTGFAKFHDGTGREVWRAVLLDSGGTFEGAGYAPWNFSLAQKGYVEAKDIPQDVSNAMKQLARASDADLVHRAGLDPSLATDAALANAIPKWRERAQEVLGHYGMSWEH
jgi:hypothetical protein